MLRNSPEASPHEAGRLACGGVRMCVSLRETVGDMDVDDEATGTYLRRVSRRDTHIRCAPSRKRTNHAFTRKARCYGYSMVPGMARLRGLSTSAIGRA